MGIGEESWLETTVSEPGVLRFQYYRPIGSYLSFSHWELFGQTTNVISLYDNWECCWWPKEIRIPSGVRVLRWRGFGRARLDQVSFTPGLPPLITFQPQSQYVRAGQSATFAVQAEGTEPFAYQWFREYSGPIPDATNRTYTITNASREDHGNDYSVEVRNAVGSVRSDYASLWVPNPPSLYISSPTDGAEVASGTVYGSALVYNSPGFGISRIELFDGLTKLAEGLNPGNFFSWTLTNVPPGRRLRLRAVATDSAGQQGTSATVTVSVVLRLIPQGTLWKYLNTRSGPAPGWKDLGFNDSSWPFGVAGFGYPPGTPAW